MIKSDTIKLEDLIEKNELIVPPYQRGYDWKIGEAEEFWEDLYFQYEIKKKTKSKFSRR